MLYTAVCTMYASSWTCLCPPLCPICILLTDKELICNCFVYYLSCKNKTGIQCPVSRNFCTMPLTVKVLVKVLGKLHALLFTWCVGLHHNNCVKQQLPITTMKILDLFCSVLKIDLFFSILASLMSKTLSILIVSPLANFSPRTRLRSLVRKTVG